VETEIWKDIKDYENLYEVSNFGKVRRKRTQKIMSIYLNHKGYCKVSLSRKNKSKNHRVHRLVAIAFLENNNYNLEVNHKDFNKLNNHVDNLEWVTGEENIKHYQDFLLSTKN